MEIAAQHRDTRELRRHLVLPSGIARRARQPRPLVERMLRAVETSRPHVSERQRPKTAERVEAQPGAVECRNRLRVLGHASSRAPRVFGDGPLELAIDGEAPQVAVRRMDRCGARSLYTRRFDVAEDEEQIGESGASPRFGLREARDLRVTDGAIEVDARRREIAAGEPRVAKPLARRRCAVREVDLFENANRLTRARLGDIEVLEALGDRRQSDVAHAELAKRIPLPRYANSLFDAVAGPWRRPAAP